MKGTTTTLMAAAALVMATNAGAYETITVTDGGTVKGQVKYDGSPPARKKIDITKDAKVCGTESSKLSETLIVGAGGGVANAVVRLTGVTKGVALEAQTPTMDQRVCQFRPHVLVFPAGSTLTVLNSDGILHNVHTYGEANPPVNKAQPGFKKKIQLKFDKPEFPVRVECDAHPWMKAWFVVQDHPYYALTDESGNFSLANVPPGDYTVEAWQETLGRQTAKVSVKSGAEESVMISFAAQ